MGHEMDSLLKGEEVNGTDSYLHCQVLGQGSRYEGEDNYTRQPRRGQTGPRNQTGPSLRPSELREKDGFSDPVFEGRKGLSLIILLESLALSPEFNELVTNREASRWVVFAFMS